MDGWLDWMHPERKKTAYAREMEYRNLGAVHQNRAITRTKKPKAEKPSALNRILGLTMAGSLPNLANAVAHNAATAKKRTGSAFGRDEELTKDLREGGVNWFEERLGTREANDIIEKAGYIDPARNWLRAVKGEDYETGGDAFQDLGVKNKAVATGLGLTTDILGDPTTYVAPFGRVGTVRTAAKAAVPEIVNAGLDIAKLTDLGVDLTKLSPATVEAAKSGAVKLSKIPATDQARIMSRITAAEAAKAAGKPVSVNLPFARKVDGKLVGAQALVPSATKRSAADILAESKRIEKIGALEGVNETLMTGAARKLNKAKQKALDLGLPVISPKLALAESAGLKAAKDAGKIAESVKVTIPGLKTGENLGGILGSGIGQEAFEVGSAAVKERLRKVPILAAGEQLFNPVGKALEHGGGGPLSEAMLRHALQTSQSLGNYGRNVAVREGVELAQDLDERERHLMTQAINEVVSPEDAAALRELEKQRRTFARKEVVSEGRAAKAADEADPFNLELITGINRIESPALVLKRRRDKLGRPTGSFKAPYRPGQAASLAEMDVVTAIENADTRLAEIAEDRDLIARIVGVKKADTMERRAARLRGESVGTERAVGEAERGATDLRKLAEEASERASRAGEEAAKRAPAGLIAGEMKQAARVPIGFDRQAWGTDDFWKAVDSPDPTGGYNEFSVTELVPDIKQIMKGSTITDLVLDETPVRVINSSLADQLGATEAAFYAPATNGPDWGDAIYLVADRLDDPNRSPLDLILHELNHAVRNENMRLDPTGVGHVKAPEEQAAWRMVDGLTSALEARRAPAVASGVAGDIPRYAPERRYSDWRHSIAESVGDDVPIEDAAEMTIEDAIIAVSGTKPKPARVEQVLDPKTGEVVEKKIRAQSAKGRVRVEMSESGGLTEEFRRAFTGGNIEWAGVSDPRAPGIDNIASEIAQEFPHLLPPDATGNDLMDAMVALREKRAAARATARTQAQRIDDFVQENPEVVMEIMEGRIASALDAGDLQLATHHQRLYDDFVEDYTAKPVSAGIFDDEPGRTLPRDPNEAIRAIIARNGQSRTTLKDRLGAEYKRGRAVGMSELERMKGAEAVRIARMEAKAAGRKANYEEVINGLGTKAAKLEGAAEMMRGIEKEALELEARRERLMARFTPVAESAGKIDELTDAAAVARSGQEAIEAIQPMAGKAAVKPAQFIEYLTDMGVSEPRAREMWALYESKIVPRLDEMRQAKVAAGLPDKELRGVGTGSYGHAFQTDPSAPSFMEQQLAVTNRESQVREAMQREMYGDNPDIDLDALRRADGGDVDSAIDGYVDMSRPAQPQHRVHATPEERLMDGLATETDYAQIHAAKVNADYQAMAKARREDIIVSQYGDMLDPEFVKKLERGKARLPVGTVAYPVTRGGEKVMYAVPDKIGSFMASLDSMFVVDSAAKGWLRGFDAVMGTWKKLATSFNIGFHSRNLSSNYWLAWTEGMHDPRGWEMAAEIALTDANPARRFRLGDRVMSAAEIKDEALRMDVMKGTFGPSEVMATTSGAIRSATPGAGSPLSLADELASGAGTAIEDSSRLAVYINALEKGMTPDAASAMASRTLYDYSAASMTPTERNVLKRLMPFYSWTRNNIPHMLDIYASSGKLGQYKHLRDNLFAGEGIDLNSEPENLQSSFALPIPGSGSMYATAMPFADLTKLDVANPSDAARQWVAGMNPIAKHGIEMALGIDSFTGRPIEPYPGGPGRAPGELQALYKVTGFVPPGTMELNDRYTGEDYLGANARLVKLARDLNPMYGKLGTALDPRSGVAPGMLNMLAGIKTAQIDEDGWESQRLREESKELEAKRRLMQDRGEIPRW